jgi:CspA family cold shock protein
MACGTVKWFNNSKGYGFIESDEGQDNIFAHFSCVEMDGYKTLKRGQKVKFTVNDGPKGLQASDIQISAE